MVVTLIVQWKGRGVASVMLMRRAASFFFTVIFQCKATCGGRGKHGVQSRVTMTESRSVKSFFPSS